MEFFKSKSTASAAINFLIVLVCISGTGYLLSGCNSGNKKSNGSSEEEEQPREEKVIPAYYKNFQGTIGGRKAILQLIKYDDRYEGVLIDSVGQPLTVSGQKDSSEQLNLISYQHYNPVDTFTGSFSQPGVFQGFWSDTAGSHDPFIFQEIYLDGTYRWQVYTLKDSLAFDSARQSPMARVQMSLLWPDKKSLQPSQWSLLTDMIVKKYINADTLITDASVLLNSAADTFFRQYKQLKQDMPPKGEAGIRATFNWEYDVNMMLLWNADSVVSLAFKSYQYTGGAHGLRNTFLTVFDLRRNRVLTLNDIFRPGYTNKLQAILENKLRQEFDIPQHAALNGDNGILFDKHLALTKNFYITGTGIGFIYNPYEVAPYVVGQIELFVPYAELQDLLKTPVF